MQAKDLKPGWFFDCGDGELAMAIRKSDRWPSIWVAKRGNTGPIQYPLADTTEVTHHPECTGWDWPIPKRIRLEVGKRYVCRDGSVTKPMTRGGSDRYPFLSTIEYNGITYRCSWTEYGKYDIDCGIHDPSDQDIISEYVEPEPAIDPGEGWRLLGDDDWIEDGDEFLNRKNVWKPCMFSAGNKVHEAFDSEICKAFRRRIEPVYVPFTQETFRPHRDRWIVLKSNRCVCRVVRVNKERVLVGSASIDWQQLFDEYEFEDGGVCGVKHG